MDDGKSKRWPKTVDQAVDMLIVLMGDEDKRHVRGLSHEGLTSLHYGLGAVIRNSFGLWEGNKELLESCGSPGMQPDSAAAVIIEAVWRRLRS